MSKIDGVLDRVRFRDIRCGLQLELVMAESKTNIAAGVFMVSTTTQAPSAAAAFPPFSYSSVVTPHPTLHVLRCTHTQPPDGVRGGMATQERC